jgi:hypothetical protein
VNQNISLWSQVILASLLVPRNFQQESRYRNSEMVKRIEDIKVRIKHPRAQRQGRGVEARFNLEIIALVEDFQGRSQVFSRQEVIKDRLELGDFDHPLEADKELNYIVQIHDLKWDGEMKGQELIINYDFSYMLYSAQEQVVKLFADEEMRIIEQEDLREMETEIDRVRNDNELLNRKLFLYERDITSLRRGIKKVEDRNTFLKRELNGYQELIENLREAITRKDLLICNYENHKNGAHAKIFPMFTSGAEESTVGKSIKRMFLNGE